MKKCANGGGIGSGCGDSARVIDPVSADSATDAASDLIADLVVLFLGLWVIVRYIFQAIRWAITTVKQGRLEQRPYTAYPCS